MSDQLTRLAAQLRDELGCRAHPLAVLAGPDETLTWPTRLEARAEGIALALLSSDDEEAAGMAVDVMAALWPTGDPPPEWWTTPVGRVLARSVGADDAEAVTHSVAAAMLGVTRGTIAQLVHRGKLDRHPDGGVLRSSIMQRIAQRHT